MLLEDVNERERITESVLSLPQVHVLILFGIALHTHLTQVKVRKKLPGRAASIRRGPVDSSTGAAAQAHCGQSSGGLPIPASPDAPEPALRSYEHTDRDSSFALSLSRSIDPINSPIRPCKNNVNTPCRVCFSSTPPPFPEVCSPVHDLVATKSYCRFRWPSSVSDACAAS